MHQFSRKYETAITNCLRNFVSKGDDVVCIGYFTFKYGDCQMCEKKKIKWHYVLENLRTHQSLIVGSECVQNYQRILSEWGYKPEHITFPEFLRERSQWIVKGNPNAIVFDDGVVMRFQTDCEAILSAVVPLSGRVQYQYASRAVIAGTTTLIAVGSMGRHFSDDHSPEQHFLSDSEFGWDYCCGSDQLSCCPDCDNEMCPVCGAGCMCEDAGEVDMYYDDEDYA